MGSEAALLFHRMLARLLAEVMQGAFVCLHPIIDEVLLGDVAFLGDWVIIFSVTTLLTLRSAGIVEGLNIVVIWLRQAMNCGYSRGKATENTT